ncbi:MAG TPA: hypothetical protein VEL76_28805, partial [Gemmataceae bacterium]|nr:hypothetical protein [Gemmataceae bacterium]
DTGDLNPFAKNVLDDLGGYAEVSPSRTGAKAIVRGRKPGKRCETTYDGHKIEVYDCGRFFALTGERLSVSTAEIPERQQQLEALYHRVFGERQAAGGGGANGSSAGNKSTNGKARGSVWAKPYEQLTDEDILQLAGEAKNGDKFRSLWAGDTSGHAGDDSRADAALCAILAYWCRRDAERIDRLFRQSALMRPKWDERHGGDGATYGQMTVAFACSVTADVYSGPAATRAQHRQEGRGSRAVAGDGAAEDSGPLRTKDVILAHLRERYEPTFRRGNVLYSPRLGREVKAAEACYAPNSGLLAQMERASDPPRTGKGATDLDALPKHFRNWAPVAWTDLLDSLPEEEASGKVVEPAREEFRRQVTAALCTLVPLAYRHQGSERADVERRPLIEWARMFAKPGRWGDVRGYRLWARLDGNPADGVVLRVALRVELFAQAHAADLKRLSQPHFTALAQTYGIGKPVKVKGGDLRAVELDPDYLADLLDSPAEEKPGAPDGQEGSPAHARDEQASERPPQEDIHA